MPRERLGTNLRIVRERLGLTLREVAIRSAQFADMDLPQGRISASWLRRVEHDPKRELSAGRLIALLKIYGLTLEELLTLDPRNGETGGRPEFLTFDTPQTALVPLGPLQANARLILPDDSHTSVVPLNTQIVRPGQPQRPGRFIRAVVGKLQNYLEPIVPAGSLVLVDTHRRSLNLRRGADIELHRPMFLLELHDGNICCWCEPLGRQEGRIVVLPHPRAAMKVMELRADRDVTVRGRIVAVRIPTMTEDGT